MYPSSLVKRSTDGSRFHPSSFFQWGSADVEFSVNEDGSFYTFHHLNDGKHTHECAICDGFATHSEELMHAHVQACHKPFVCPGCGETKETFFDQETCSNIHSLEIEWMEQDMEALTVSQPVPHCKPTLSQSLKKKPKKVSFNVNNLKKIFK